MENNLPELTEEQKKEVEKLIKQAQKSLFFIGIKFIGGLFGLSIISFMVMIGLLLQSSTETQQNFMVAANVINIIFMYSYLYGQLKANSQMVDEKIQEILKKTE